MQEQNISYEYDRYFSQWLTQKTGMIIFSSKRQNLVFGLLVNPENGGLSLKKWCIPHIRSIASAQIKDEDKGQPPYLALWTASEREVLERVQQELKEDDSKDKSPSKQSTSSTRQVLIPKRHYFADPSHKIYQIASSSDGTLFATVVDNLPNSNCRLLVYKYKTNGEREVEPYQSDTFPKMYSTVTGFALKDNKPAYVVLTGDKGEGLLYSLIEDKVVVKDLSYPTNCIWDDGQLYLLEAGTGYFGWVDIEKGEFIRERFLPGFLRGLEISDGYAIIGSSLDRYESQFSGTKLGEKLKSEKVPDRCGLYIVDLKSFDVTHSLIIMGGIFEIDAVHLVKMGLVKMGLDNKKGLDLLQLIVPDSFSRVLEI